MFSILLPIYRGDPEYLSQTLESVVRQTYQDFECHVIYNGGRDEEICKIVEYYSSNDRRFKCHSLKVANKANAVNYGVTKSTKKYVSILDADDVWFDEKLEQQADFLSRHEGVDILGTQMVYIDDVGDSHKTTTPQLPITPFHHKKWLENNDNPICNSSVVYKTSLHLDGVGFYNTFYHGVEDYEFWKRSVLIWGKTSSNIEGVLVKHRLHDKSNFNADQKQNLHKRLIDEVYRHVS